MDLFECKTEKRNSQCEHRQPMEQNKKQFFNIYIFEANL